MSEHDEKLLLRAKAFFDFLRNAAIVVSFGVLSRLINDIWIYVIYYASFFALTIHAYAYMPLEWLTKFFAEHPRLNFKWAIILAILITTPPSMWAVVQMSNAITAVVEKQVGQITRPVAQPVTPCRFSLDLSGYRCI